MRLQQNRRGRILKTAARYATHLVPDLSRILSCVAHHLERKRNPYVSTCLCVEEPTDQSIRSHTLPFLRVLVAACANSRIMSDSLLANRLVRAVIPYLTKPLLPQLEAKAAEPTDAGGSSKRKGKKRARGYEGDEVFKTNPDILFGSPHEERVVMLSIEGQYYPFRLVLRTSVEHFLALRLLPYDTGVSPEVYSVLSRLLLSLLLHLSRLPPSMVSKDVTFHNDLSSKLQSVCIELASTKSAALGRTLPLLMNLLDKKVISSTRLSVWRVSDKAFF